MDISKCYTALFRPTNSTIVQIPRAVFVSVIALGLDFLVMVLLVELAKWPPIAAASVSYLLGGVVQYLLCSWWVFPTAPRNTVMGFVAFSLLSLVGLAITAGTIWLLRDHWHLDYRLAKCAACGLAFCWNFSSRKYLLFQEQRGNTPASLPAVSEEAFALKRPVMQREDSLPHALK